MNSEACRTVPQEPLSFTITPEAHLKLAEKTFADYDNGVSNILANVHIETATFENFALPIAHLYQETRSLRSVIMFFKIQPPSDLSLRDASQQALLTTRKYANIPDLPKYYQAILDKDARLGLEPRRLLQINIPSSEPAGTDHEKLVEVDRKIRWLERQFNTNLIQENGGIWANEKELKGVPSEIINTLEEGKDSRKGTFRVIFDQAVRTKILEYAADPEFRQNYYIESDNKCNENATIFQSLVENRHEKATLLGYPDFMTYAMKDSILAKPQAVQMLLAKIKKRIQCSGIMEFIKGTKLADTGVTDKTTRFSDVKYYQRIFIENKFSIDYKIIAEYFPLSTTIRNMLDLFGDLFGLVFIEEVNDNVWHSGVRLFSAWDDEKSGGNFSGYLYIDTVRRPGSSKQVSAIQLEPSFIRRNGSRRYASSAIILNSSKTTTTGDCLLAHDEVTDLFHELAHSMHHLLSRTMFADFHAGGKSGEFQEIPSVLFENWCWEVNIIQRLSRHFKSGEKMPDDLANKLSRTKHIRSHVDPLQYTIAAFDLAVYTPLSQSDIKQMKLPKKYNDIYTDISGLEGFLVGEPKDELARNLAHGYTTRKISATIYPGRAIAHLLSFFVGEVIWKKFFQKDPMDKNEGMRFRQMILERGTSQDPMELLENYLGQKLNVENLCNSET